MALRRWYKVGWGLADLGIVIFVVVKQLLILAFLTSYLGVPIGLAGVVTTSILIFDMITDPIIGYLSDKTESRLGRRIPWMIIGAVLLAGAMVGLFAVPGTLVGAPAALWVGGFFVLATIGFTMVAIPYGAMAGEMTQDPRDRSEMMAWRMGFASVGILIGGAILPLLAGNTREGYLFASLVVAPLIVGSIWTSVLMLWRAPRIAQPTTIRPKRMAQLVWQNKAFVTLTCLYGVMTLAIALITAGMPFAALYLISDDGGSLLSGAASALGILSLMFAAFVVGSILSQAVWVKVSARLGKLWALCMGLLVYALLLWGLYLAVPSGNVTAIAAVFVFVGMANGSYQQIPWAMYPDLMDVTRRETGEAIEGAFSAIWLFGQKAANAVAPALMAVILGAAGWQETTEGTTEQTKEALLALERAMTLLPAGILVASVCGLALIYRPMAGRLVQ